MAHRIQLTLVAALLVGACGIDVVGIDPIDGAAAASIDADRPESDSGSPADAFASPDANICNLTCPTVVAPTGFQPALFGDGTCPAGFDGSDVIENPSAKPDSCTCGTCAATGGACNATQFLTKGGNAQCAPGGGATIDFNGGACTDRDNSVFSYDYTSMVIPTGVPGTCKADGNVVADKIDRPTHRLCAKRAEVCGGVFCAVPGNLSACVVAEGDVACPASAPTKHLVGADVDAKCAGCSCTPTVTCGGTYTVYSGSSCTGSVRGTVTTSCTFVNQASYYSYRATQVVAAQACANVGPAGPATLSLKTPRTVCCP